MECKEAGLHTG